MAQNYVRDKEIGLHSQRKPAREEQEEQATYWLLGFSLSVQMQYSP